MNSGDLSGELIRSLNRSMEIANALSQENEIKKSVELDIMAKNAELVKSEELISEVSAKNIELQKSIDMLSSKNSEQQKQIEQLEDIKNKLKNGNDSLLSQPILSDKIIYGIPNLEKRKEEAIFDAINHFSKACPYCGNNLYEGHILNSIEYDHFFPISKGGQDFPWNILPICISCNRKKRDRMPYEFLDEEHYQLCYNYLFTIKKKYTSSVEDYLVSIEVLRGIIEKWKNDIIKHRSIEPLMELVNTIYPGFVDVSNSTQDNLGINCRNVSEHSQDEYETMMARILDEVVQIDGDYKSRDSLRNILSAIRTRSGGLEAIDSQTLSRYKKTVNLAGLHINKEGEVVIKCRYKGLQKMLGSGLDYHKMLQRHPSFDRILANQRDFSGGQMGQCMVFRSEIIGTEYLPS